MCWMDLMISWSAPATPFDACLIILLPLPCPLLLLAQAILFLLPLRLLVYLLLGAFLPRPADRIGPEFIQTEIDLLDCHSGGRQTCLDDEAAQEFGLLLVVDPELDRPPASRTEHRQ